MLLGPDLGGALVRQLDAANWRTGHPWPETAGCARSGTQGRIVQVMSPSEDPTDAKAQLAKGPAADIRASVPRGPDEIQFEPGDEDREPVPSKPGDPLDGIPSVPVNVTGGVPESQVTDRQGVKPNSGEPTGGSETPPASKTP